MNTIKTITTVDGMNAVDFSISDGNYYWFRNLGDTTVYVSGNENIIAGADGVAELTSGGSVCLEGIGGKVYILGAGKVEIHKSGNKHCPFKVAPDLGGGKEVSGESAYTIENAVDYPVMGLNLYGKSVQDGTPTPENPVEIVSVGDSGSVGITACGKNLLNPTLQTITENGVTCTNNGDGTYTLNGTATKNAPFNFLVSEDAKNFLKPYKGKTLRTVGAPIDSGVNFGVQGGEKDGVGLYEIGYGRNITISNDVESFKTVIIKMLVLKGTTVNNAIVKPMITTDLTATYDDFEPYHGATANITSALTLCGIPVESGGNYTDSNGQQWICDTLEYNADGTGKITKRTAKIDSYNSETITTPYISTMGGLTTGATIIYQIAEPQEIELTAAEMSALMSLQTFNGVTNIFNDGGADMDVYYCSNKTLSEYVMPITMGLQKQIDELRAAVLSLGGNV